MNSVLLLDSWGDLRSGRERRGSEMDEMGQLQVQVSKLTVDVAKLTVDVEYIKNDVAAIKTRMDRLDDKLGAVDARLYKVEKDLTEKFGSMKLWVMGLYVTQAASMLLIMSKGFKWL